ncbi:MAG: hypothetical protein QGG25_05335, partial [Phycisphaerae bacterium]|nr:hypothetical protein [Phycisphaerae bacterium]
MNERRVSCAILLAGAVLACFLTLCGPVEHCDAQTTQTATQPAAPATLTAPKPKPGWYVPGSSNPAGKTTIGSLDSRTGYTFQVELVSRYAAVRTLLTSPAWQADPFRAPAKCVAALRPETGPVKNAAFGARYVQDRLA